MKTKRTLCFSLIFTLLFAFLNVSVRAESKTEAPEISPVRYNYVSTIIDDFYIVNGTGYVEVYYSGTSGLTTRAEISIKLQHQFLFWWFDVSNGEWSDTIYGFNGDVNHSLALSNSGNYRAVINIKVYGPGSDYDEINRTPTASN